MSTRKARKNRKNKLLAKNNKSLAVVKPKDKGGKPVETKYPRKVEDVRCQFCAELLVRVYGYAWIQNPAGQTQVFCMKCKHAKMNNQNVGL